MEINNTTKFDPSKNYEWKPEDTFMLSGQEFAFMYNFVTSEKAKLMAQLELMKILEQKLVKAVEDGVAKEVAKEQVDEKKSDIFLPNQEIIKG